MVHLQSQFFCGASSGIICYPPCGGYNNVIPSGLNANAQLILKRLKVALLQEGGRRFRAKWCTARFGFSMARICCLLVTACGGYNNVIPSGLNEKKILSANLLPVIRKRVSLR
jgi:hypothetical protein